MVPSPNASRPSPLVTNLALALVCLIWGSTWLVIREGLDEVPPYTSAAIRFIFAGVVLSPVAHLLGKREGGSAPAPWLWITVGVTNFAISYGLVYRTETFLPSGLVSLLWGVFPMMMALGAHFFLPGEQLRGVQWLGFVFGLVGLALLFLTDLRQFGPDGVPAAMISFISPVVSTAGNIVLKRYGANVSSLKLNRNAMLLGGALLTAVALVLERGAPAHWTVRAIASVAYLSLFGSALAFGLYFWLLRYIDAHKLSLTSYVIPPIALGLGALVRHEPLTESTFMGALFILCGLLLVVSGKRLARQAGAKEPARSRAR